MKTILGTSLFVLAATTAQAAAPDRAAIEKLISEHAGQPVHTKIESIGASFLGSPYVLGNLGEGPGGELDQDPLYRFDVFDCVTLVETVSALALAKDYPDFEKKMMEIRYAGGKISFLTRNHFTDRDWVPNNVKAGFVRDITREVAEDAEVSIARARVDVSGWCAKMKPDSVVVPGSDDAEKEARLEKIREQAKAFPAEDIELPYLSLEMLLGPGGQALLDRIPSAAIVDIVRPNWDLVEAAGTRMNVSHQGFAIRKDGQLLFRHASSSGDKKVREQPLREYLEQFKEHATIKGIHLLEVLPGR